VAAVAYVDPGNVATNTSAGASYGYLLLWVLVGATLMAGLVQYLSAKVGWLTGDPLPALVGRRIVGVRGSPSGCRPNLSPPPPMSPRSWVALSRSGCCSTCRWWPAR
jgi:hypothetical protein